MQKKRDEIVLGISNIKLLNGTLANFNPKEIPNYLYKPSIGLFSISPVSKLEYRIENLEVFSLNEA